MHLQAKHIGGLVLRCGGYVLSEAKGQSMQFAISVFLSLVTVLIWGVSSPHATIINVSTASGLQSALNTAVAGDEIVLANGTYAGKFTITTNNGTSGQKITVRAANRHLAILEAPTAACSWSETDSGILLTKSYWVIKDIKMRNQVWGIYLSGSGASNNIIQDMIIDNYRGPALMLANSANNNLVQNNAIGLGEPSCLGTPGTDGIQNWKSANNVYLNNIVLPNGDDGYACAGAGGCSGSGGMLSGYGIYLNDADDSGGASTHDNTVQGNLIIGGGRGVFRVLNGVRTMVRDNAFLWGGGGGMATDHCSDDFNSFINNIGYGNYFLGFTTKGNDGTRGNHLWQHNLMVTSAFSRDGGHTMANTGTCGGSKINMVLKDNLLMAEVTLLGGGNKLLSTVNPSTTQFTTANHNLFWAPSTPSTWTFGYVFGANDIHAQASQPQFVNAGQGDFTLATGSPGKNAASDGKDIGIEYNQYLKKTWMQKAFQLPTQQQSNLTTSASFPVDPNHYYQVWFYIPTAAYNSIETFNVEGTLLQRDIHGLSTLVTGTQWVQANGPQRWITLGTHKAADRVLNISWTNPGSASQIYIRQIPTADEAYTWIVEPSKLAPPQRLRVVQD